MSILKEPIRPGAVKAAQIFENRPPDPSGHPLAQTQLLLIAVLILLETKLNPVPLSVCSRVPTLGRRSINDDQRPVDKTEACFARKPKQEVLVLAKSQLGVKAANSSSKIRLCDQGWHPDGGCSRTVQH